MLGAIAGDIIGSVYEFHNMKSTDFPLFTRGSTFTDDTVLTVAVADCILHGKKFAPALKEYGRRYRNAGYGPMFIKWLGRDSYNPYNSFGNGSAMRVSPVGFAYSNLNTVLKVAEASASVTHNHPEGIKGAQAIAAAIFFLLDKALDWRGMYFLYELSRRSSHSLTNGWTSGPTTMPMCVTPSSSSTYASVY